MLALPLALMAAALLLALAQPEPLRGWLVEATGETELRQQVIALLSRLSAPRLETADLAPVAYAGVYPYGANTFFEQEVEEWKLRRSMEMLRQAGVRWVRQEIPWRDIEVPAKGQYRDRFGNDAWEKYDRFIRLAKEYGLEIVARLDAPPDWSRKDNRVYNRPPDDFADFGDFAYAFAQRYRGLITYYQVWNEPNIYPEWGKQPPSASSYVELLKLVYGRIKEANPQAVVISAALAPTLGTPDGYNESDLSFLQQMYDAGAKGYFDIMMVMGYGLWSGPGDRRAEPGRTNFSRAQLIREIMVRNGDAGKAIWLAEVGWNALPEGFPGAATHGRVSVEQQASYTVQAYRRAQEEWPWAGVLFYWYFRRVTEEPDQVLYYFRMVDPDFTPRPVYHAFAEMTAKAPALHMGFHQEDHWALSYEGLWEDGSDSRASLGRFRRAAMAGATLRFVFEGSELELVTRGGLGAGAFSVRVDGSAAEANLLPRDSSGRAVLYLGEGPERWGRRVKLASGLAPGSHEVEMTALEAGAVVDGVVVYTSDYARWRAPLAAVLGAGLVAALVAASLARYGGRPE